MGGGDPNKKEKNKKPFEKKAGSKTGAKRDAGLDRNCALFTKLLLTAMRSAKLKAHRVRSPALPIYPLSAVVLTAGPPPANNDEKPHLP